MGENPTCNMIGSALLERLPKSAVLINASRGEVVNEDELLAFLKARPDVFSILDVWHNEPDLNLELMALATIATPHIAGYSRRAKTLATKMLAESFNSFLNSGAEPLNSPIEPAPKKLVLKANASACAVDFVSAALPIQKWSAEFKLQISKARDRADTFDLFRKSMVDRVEFSDFEIDPAQLNEQELAMLKNIGFN